MKKIFKILASLVCVLSLASCKEKEPDLLTAKEGVTVKTFSITINDVTVTNTMMASYPVYEGLSTTVNSEGNKKEVYYIGYKLDDCIKAAGLTGKAGKITSVATDNYECVWEGSTKNCVVAVQKNDGSKTKDFSDGPWFAPCYSTTSGDINKNVASITIEGLSK